MGGISGLSPSVVYLRGRPEGLAGGGLNIAKPGTAYSANPMQDCIDDWLIIQSSLL
jgi:hypothetical protein